MFDSHTHSSLSYCAKNELTLDFYSRLLDSDNELEKVAITDHGMAVYFPNEIAWNWGYIEDSRIFDKYRDRGNLILEEHLSAIAAFGDDRILPGIELEMMHDGRFTLDPAFNDRFAVKIGSVHFLPERKDAGSSPDKILDCWKKHMAELLTKEFDILGHPFRWLANQMKVPFELIPETVSEAKKHGKALELNSHYVIDSDIEMVKEIAKQGAVISFATDSHQVEEPGDFSYHHKVIELAGLKLSDLNVFDV